MENERLFALMYYAPEEELWEDIGIYRANPLRIEQNYELIKESRAKALEIESERGSYLAKSMNFFVSESSGEQYININDVRKCRLLDDEGNFMDYDWYGKDVYIGVDLSYCGTLMQKCVS